MTNHQNDSKNQAQLVLSTTDLTQEMAFFTRLGFRLHQIFPSDDPAVAVMEGHGLFIRLDKEAKKTSNIIHLLTDNPEEIGVKTEGLIAPNGTLIKILSKSYHLNTPATQHKFEVRQLKDNDSWIIGRAGMLYRDLIPDRLGGSIIASHISIPKGGPVPDVVHYHTIGFQLIFCYSGWVKLVYEDQGPPFILYAGDCVTQPPEIRHRVLEASDHLEVIEIGVPADHMTTIDHEMELPTESHRPEREFQGQRFCYHLSKEASWKPWRLEKFEYRDTGINKATKGMASVHVIQANNSGEALQTFSHDADILFTFVMKGKMSLLVEGHKSHQLKKGDAYVIPPDQKYQIGHYSDDLELLEVSLPGTYKTQFY